MKTEQLLILAGIGVGAYFLLKKDTYAGAITGGAVMPVKTGESVIITPTNPPTPSVVSPPSSATPTGYKSVILATGEKAFVPTTSAIPTWYAKPTAETRKSQIVYTSAEDVISKSSTPKATASTLSKLKTYAVSPYSTYRKSV